MPEAAGARAMGRLLWPPIIAVIGVLPVLGGRNAWRHHQPILVGLSTGLQPVIFLVIGVIVWVRFQEEAHVWFARQMDTAKTGAAGGQDRSQ